MTIKRWILILALVLVSAGIKADTDDYKQDPTYLALRDSMNNAFNQADSARFFPAVKDLEDYLLEQNDLHAYYTQRCNEIVFMMNTQKIFEAYRAAQQLSKELRERQLDSEIYMAINMMGHIQRYCGNKESAKNSFREVIRLMEQYGYYESMPPIYMNIVNVEMDDNPDEALMLLDRALEIAKQYSPERTFDIECRKALSYYNRGDMDEFVKGYQYYKSGVAEGKTSVHGRSLEIYYQAYLGNVDKAVEMAKASLGDENYEIIANLYKNAGRWEEAYEAQHQNMVANDSINTVILSNSMLGIQNELALYEIEREAAKTRTITMAVIIVLLLLLIGALAYIVFSHHRHMKQLDKAYQHALRSDNMKTIFIQNMSHEVRTPLNIITGFAQVIADPDMAPSPQERQDIAKMVLKSTHTITRQIDEILELSMNETAGRIEDVDQVDVAELLSHLIGEHEENLKEGVVMKFDNALPDNFTLATNKSHLNRMVDILLDNACKYTVEGSITLKAETAEKPRRLKITVEDTGCGIAPEEAAHIFERFVKLDTFKEGLGLGLTLCRILAKRMDGTVELDSTYEGPGARFVISIPLG